MSKANMKEINLAVTFQKGKN